MSDVYRFLLSFTDVAVDKVAVNVEISAVQNLECIAYLLLIKTLADLPQDLVVGRFIPTRKILKPAFSAFSKRV